MLLLVVGWAGSVHAQQQISGRRVALVVGNAAYTAVSPLANAGNDARLIAGTLRTLGFTLVGGGAQLDLDRPHLAQAIEAFGRSLNGADVALFYYSGHGLQVQGVNWLVPVDANPTRPKDLDFQMVDADLVLRQMDGSGTRLNIVLLDACRNNPFLVSGLRSAQGGLAEMRAPEGTLISYATQPGNVAVDGAGANSPYTTALAAAMRQPGIDVFRMLNQVGLQVKRATAGSQQPWVSTSPIDGDFYFAASAPVSVAKAAEPAGTAGLAAAPSLPSPVADPVRPAIDPASASVAPPAPASAPVVIASIAVPTPPSQPSPERRPQPSPAPEPAPAAGGAGSLPTGRTGSIPTATHALADDIRGIADAQRCAILDTSAAGDAQLRISGLAVPGPLWTDFSRRIAQTRGVHLAASDVEMLPSTACPVVDALGPAIRATRGRTARRTMLPLRSEVIAGGTVTVTLKGVIGDAPVFDLFRTDGMVEHLPLIHESRRGDDLVVSFAAPPKGALGRQLLVAIAGLTPGALGTRPPVEPSSPYLGSLGQALAANPAAQADMAPLLVQAAAAVPFAVPTVRRVTLPSNASHCSGILERAQLGEPLADSDRALLRSCR